MEKNPLDGASTDDLEAAILATLRLGLKVRIDLNHDNVFRISIEGLPPVLITHLVAHRIIGKRYRLSSMFNWLIISDRAFDQYVDFFHRTYSPNDY